MPDQVLDFQTCGLGHAAAALTRCASQHATRCSAANCVSAGGVCTAALGGKVATWSERAAVDRLIQSRDDTGDFGQPRPHAGGLVAGMGAGHGGARASRYAGGARTTRWTAASSATRPAYITIARSQVSAITPEVMRDHDDRGTELGLELQNQVQDLRLDGHVERRRRLIRDQDLRLAASAMAIMTRWRMPPDSSCGYDEPRRGLGDADEVEHRGRARGGVPGNPHVPNLRSRRSACRP